MAKMVKPIPEGYHSLSIYIPVKNAGQAINFYKEAFKAEEKTRINLPNGRVMFAELQIGDCTLQLSDEVENHEFGIASPISLGGTSCIIHLYVEDADIVFEVAIKAGAKIKRPLDNMLWGDRYGQLEDPFGHLWSIATRIKEVSSEYVQKRLAKLISEYL